MPFSAALPARVWLDANGRMTHCTPGAEVFVDSELRLRLYLGGSQSEGAETYVLPQPQPRVEPGGLVSTAGRVQPTLVECVALPDEGLLVLLRAPRPLEPWAELFRTYLHDLRSPISTGLLLCHSMGVELQAQGGEAAAIGTRYLSRLEAELSRLNIMASLGRGLRQLGYEPSEIIPADVLIERSLGRHRRSLTRQGVRLVQPPAPQARVVVPSEAVATLLGTLLLVAVQASPGGWFEAKAEEVPTGVRLEVHASGFAELSLARLLTGPSPEPSRLTWMEVGVATARWVAEVCGLKLEASVGGESDGISLVLPGLTPASR